MTEPSEIELSSPWAIHESDAPWSASDAESHPSSCPSSYLVGREGTLRETGYGENSWLSSIVLLMLVVLAFNAGNCRRLFKNFAQELVGLRRRQNAFDDHTSNEARSSVIIILMLFISEGILLFTAADRWGLIDPAVDPFGAVMGMSAVALVFFLFQVGVYRVIGFTFIDRYLAMQWMRGFIASQLLLSLLLLVPALVSLYWGASATWMLAIFAIAYVIVRLLFICKGFRIFYNNFLSLLYFILYLCALEITPLLMLRKIVTDLF